jgi:hypothetical protein
LLLAVVGDFIVKLALVLAISTTLAARILLVVGVLKLIQFSKRHILNFVLLVKAAPKRTCFNAINNLGVSERISLSILDVFNDLLE